MASEQQIHSSILELCEPVPGEIAIGSDVALKIRLTCPQGCDVGDLPLLVEDEDGRERARIASAADPVRAITLKAPAQVGAHSWFVKLPPHEQGGVRHEAHALAIELQTRPHGTSLAVWSVPSPAVKGERFSVKVGAKSSAGATLAGREIAVDDAAGKTVGRGALGDAPWPGTNALYWTEVELPAPPEEGLAWYTVNLAANAAETPHEGSASKFSVAVVRPGEHRLTVAVFEEETQAPIADAQVRVGAYGAATDASGRAELAVPKGGYELTVWKAGYDMPVQTIEISADIDLEIEAAIVPPENPYAPWSD